MNKPKPLDERLADGILGSTHLDESETWAAVEAVLRVLAASAVRHIEPPSENEPVYALIVNSETRGKGVISTDDPAVLLNFLRAENVAASVDEAALREARCECGHEVGVHYFRTGCNGVTDAATAQRQCLCKRPWADALLASGVVTPLADALREALHETWLRIHTQRFDDAKPDSFYHGILRAELTVMAIGREHDIDARAAVADRTLDRL